MKTRQQRATRTSVRRLGASGSTKTIICDMIKIGPSDTRKETGMKQAHRLRLGFPTLGHNSNCKARTACAPLIALPLDIYGSMPAIDIVSLLVVVTLIHVGTLV